MSEQTQNSRGRATATLAWLLIGAGALFLVLQWTGVPLITIFWPFFIIIPGLLFFVGMMMGGKQASPLAIPGAIITGTGLLLFFQAITNYWESWAYAWTLYPAFVGAGIVIHGAWSGRQESVRSGFRVIGISLILFIFFGAFMELVLNVSGHNIIGNLVWPGLLILTGAYLLLRRGQSPRHQEPAPAEPEFEPLDMSRASRRRATKREPEEPVKEVVAE